LATTYVYRLENEKDYGETENLIREAFWDLYKPGCDEHLMLHNMRGDPDYVRELAFVCEERANGKARIVGAIYCLACVIDGAGGEHKVLHIGPIGVAKECRNRGIGQKLIALALDRARELGYPCAVLFGNPAYYGKSGFTEAREFGLHLPDGTDLPEFLCRPLNETKLKAVSGNFRMSQLFTVDETELAEFEKRFSPKEKHVLPDQLSGQLSGGTEGGAK
jgi:predicted N-acetyltransferase YhbS